MVYLRQSAIAVSSFNVMYVLLLPTSSGLKKISSQAVLGASSRVAFFEYQTQASQSLSVIHQLAAIEQAADTVFAPQPLYTPMSLLPEMEVSVTAYTPGYQLRAPWLQDFIWDDLEAAIRSHVLPGQSVRFSSSQTNANCTACEDAFKDILSLPHDSFIRKAVTSLSHGVMPNFSWPTELYEVYHVPNALHKRRRAINTFRLFIIDVLKLKQIERLQRLESQKLFTFPGATIMVICSSDPLFKRTIYSNMLLGFISSVYGVKTPSFYLPSLQLENSDKSTQRHDQVQWWTESCPVLQDRMIRSVVKSMIDRRLQQLEEIVDGMVYFEVEPEVSLEKDRFTTFMERTNLMLFRLEHARQS